MPIQSWHLFPGAGMQRVLIIFDKDGNRVLRWIEDVPLPEEWEIDKTVRPVVE